MVWALFIILILFLLALDLFIFHRKVHKDTLKQALLWSAFWITLALLFNLYIYFWIGPTSALEFFTGYLIEKSLSLDNLFVMATIFSFFGIPEKHQHTILFWGILGALVLRLLFIIGGVALIAKFQWLIYILGIFLIFTGIKLLMRKSEMVHPQKSWAIRVVRKIVPGITPFALALVTIEYTDVIFALDSLPAIFAITKDPFIIYTSNIFAILGLRSLYFVLAYILKRFIYLKQGLAAILIFVGCKMLLEPFYVIPISLSLGIITFILLVSIFCSFQKKH